MTRLLFLVLAMGVWAATIGCDWSPPGATTSNGGGNNGGGNGNGNKPSYELTLVNAVNNENSNANCNESANQIAAQGGQGGLGGNSALDSSIQTGDVMAEGTGGSAVADNVNNIMTDVGVESTGGNASSFAGATNDNFVGDNIGGGNDSFTSATDISNIHGANGN